MVNVAYFSNQFSSTNGHGIARYSWELYRALENNGYKKNLFPISSWSDLPQNDLRKIQKETNLKLLPTGRYGTMLFWSLLQLPYIESLSKQDIDVVHAVSLGHPVPTKKRLIYTAHDIGPLTHPEYFSQNKPWIMRNALFHAAKKAQFITCVSRYTASEIETYCKKEFKIDITHKLQVVYEGVAANFNIENIEANKKKALELRKNNTPFILGVGKLSPRKNFISVLKAFNAIKDKIDHQLVIVGGNGWDFQEIEKVIIELDLKKRVELLGYVTDEYLVPLYQNASVFVYPSKFEGFGLTILEAMACGCPVITSNTTSPPEVAGNTALLIDPNSDEELAEAMFSVCDNRVKVDEMVEMGLQRAVQFSWTDCATSMIKIYETF